MMVGRKGSHTTFPMKNVYGISCSFSLVSRVLSVAKSTSIAVIVGRQIRKTAKSKKASIFDKVLRRHAIR